MSHLKERETIEVKTKAELWNWLEKNHTQDKGVWVVHYKKSSGLGDMSWESLVDACLCFGWIDSTAGKVDELRTKRYIAPRKPNSGWSEKNKRNIQRLLAEGLVQSAGLHAIEIAKKKGKWESSDKKASRAALPVGSQIMHQTKKDVPRKARMKQAAVKARKAVH